MQAYSCYIPKTYQSKILLLQTNNYFLLLFHDTAFLNKASILC